MDQINKVVFLGAPSTGKTTIAMLAAKQLNTVYIPEFGREYWQQHQVNRILTQEQLLYIAEEQIRQEDDALHQARDYLIVDTNALTTWQFAIDYYGTAHPKLEQLAKQSKHRFQIVFVCDDDIPFEDTWERSGDAKRKDFQAFLLSQLKTRGIHYHLLTGSVENRLKQVKKVLRAQVETAS